MGPVYPLCLSRRSASPDLPCRSMSSMSPATYPSDGAFSMSSGFRSRMVLSWSMHESRSDPFGSSGLLLRVQRAFADGIGSFPIVFFLPYELAHGLFRRLVLLTFGQSSFSPVVRLPACRTAESGGRPSPRLANRLAAHRADPPVPLVQATFPAFNLGSFHFSTSLV